MKQPDVAACQRIQYLGVRDIMKVMGVGYKKARKIVDACNEETKASGFETMIGKIYYKRLLKFCSPEGDENGIN